MKQNVTLALAITLCLAVHADLMVTTEPIKVIGEQAVVKLDMRNTFKRKVESASAVVFVMDPQGKVVGHGVQWVIGGQKSLSALPPGGTNCFNFMITLTPSLSGTKLTSKVMFERVILQGGRLANIPETVIINSNEK